ncbi:MAG: Hsp20/alpha crystallin family protein [Vicinamibacterales bacterium]
MWPGDDTRHQYHRVERGCGAFRRRFTLPASVDATRIGADYRDGVLTVTSPGAKRVDPARSRSTVNRLYGAARRTSILRAALCTVRSRQTASVASLCSLWTGLLVR